MSKQEEASSILKLYELRREGTMRKARDWWVRSFIRSHWPTLSCSVRGAQRYFGMVAGYWKWLQRSSTAVLSILNFQMRPTLSISSFLQT